LTKRKPRKTTKVKGNRHRAEKRQEKKPRIREPRQINGFVEKKSLFMLGGAGIAGHRGGKTSFTKPGAAHMVQEDREKRKDTQIRKKKAKTAKPMTEREKACTGSFTSGITKRKENRDGSLTSPSLI